MLRDLFSLFPACAGVIQEQVKEKARDSAFPRMCGGDPIEPEYVHVQRNFSPHVRG